MTDTEQWRAPRWAWPVTLVLAVAGLCASCYLTYGHYTTASVLACPDTGTINCAKVTTSPQSVIWGIPVADIGLAYFVAMVAICTPWAWRVAAPWMRWARVGLVIAGVLMVLHLIYAELFDINAICLYCTAVHVITVLLFCVILAATLFGSEVEQEG